MNRIRKTKKTRTNNFEFFYNVFFGSMMMSVGYTAGARGVEGLFGNKEGFKKVIGKSK